MKKTAYIQPSIELVPVFAECQAGPIISKQGTGKVDDDPTNTDLPDKPSEPGDDIEAAKRYDPWEWNWD